MEKHGKPPASSEVTPEAIYLRRREFLRDSFQFLATASGVGISLIALMRRGRSGMPVEGPSPQLTLDTHSPRDASPSGPFNTDEPRTSYQDATTYNNFYEFGTGKGDPADAARTLHVRPWTIKIDGEVNRQQEIDIDQLTRLFPLEERIYRMRCVEGWSMVLPWNGFPLGDLLRRADPTSRAKYVEFISLHDPDQMPGQRRDVLPWPYKEGLRLDEALHPLTILASGLYGRVLPQQNGAPLRLVVPWKYGFKGIKSIVRIRLTEKMPATTWNMAAPDEYGFFANVNPAVDHPRWSQATERRIGEIRRRKTLPFNGYAEQVAHLYNGLDLRAYF